MFTISLSSHPTEAEVERAMAAIGLLAGQNMMRSISERLLASAAAPAPQPAGVVPPPPPSPETAFAQQPAAAVVPPPPPPAAVTLDSKGLPWHADIHSGAKGTNKDGSWKKKKNVEEATVQAVESQLRVHYPAPQAAMPLPPAPAPQPVAVPPPPPTAANPVPPPPAGGGQVTTFIELMGKVSSLVNSQKITQQDVATICNNHGVAGAPLLAQRTDLIPSVAAHLDALAMSR